MTPLATIAPNPRSVPWSKRAPGASATAARPPAVVAPQPRYWLPVVRELSRPARLDASGAAGW